MPYPHDIHCPTDSGAPEPVGFCDRDGAKWPLAALTWQLQWAGPNIINTYFLVCPRCLDELQEQARTIVIGPDPVPIKDLRPGFQVQQEAAVGAPPIPPYVIDGET